MQKREYILIGFILLIAISTFIINRILHQGPAHIVEIRQGSTVLCELDLDKDQTYTISGENGRENVLIIQNHEVWISNASCPDKICMKQGRIHEDGQMLVCLPNEVVITLKSQ